MPYKNTGRSYQFFTPIHTVATTTYSSLPISRPPWMPRNDLLGHLHLEQTITHDFVHTSESFLSSVFSCFYIKKHNILKHPPPCCDEDLLHQHLAAQNVGNRC